MKQIKLLLLPYKVKLLVFLLLTITIYACSGSNDGTEKPQIPENPQNPENPINVDISLLKGTWEYDWNNDNNIDYLSFDGNGNGEIIEAGNLFTNIEFFDRCYKFTYRTDNNKVIIKFLSGGDGLIEITSLTSKNLSFKRTQFEYSWKTAEPKYDKISSESNWFYTDGPASEDLTVNVCGTYKGMVYNPDGSIFEKYAQVVISKVNNYSVEVKNSWKNKLDEVCYLDWNGRNKTPVMVYRKNGSYPYEVTGEDIELRYLTNGLGTLTFKGSKNEDFGSGSIYSGTIDGVDYVDLGLSVKWATHNVGAKDVEDYGSYYAWGETTDKDSYTWDNYIVAENKCGTSSDPLNNYLSSASKSIASTKYDIAYCTWGKKWRMPTVEEVEELLDKCVFYWTTNTMVNGCIVVGPNGNRLFLPASGSIIDKDNNNKNIRGYYWIATSYDKKTSYYLRIGDGIHDIFNYYRYSGRSIRAVTK